MKRTAESKAEACRIVVREHPGLEIKEWADILKREFGIVMDPKMTQNYFATAKAKVAAEPASPAHTETGKPNDQAAVNQLLEAANKLGWDRVKKITDAISG